MQKIFETLFDIFYLTTVIYLGITMMKKSKGSKEFFLFGLMALVLGLGDAFHLVPRAVALNTKGLEAFTFYLGLGKAITSVTMTIFYVLLYYVYKERYKVNNKKLDITIYILAIARILLSLMPQNKWFSKDAPLSWGIYRNIPFLVLGILIIVLFYQKQKETRDKNFKYLWLTIVLSFAFYLPVVLFSSKVPALGALMVPKTCAYIWTVLIGYSTMKMEVKNEKEIC